MNIYLVKNPYVFRGWFIVKADNEQQALARANMVLLEDDYITQFHPATECEIVEFDTNSVSLQIREVE